MEDGERMLLENLSDDIKTTNNDIKGMNKNILYLCRKCSSTDSRLKNIEDLMKLNDRDTAICLNKINKVEGKFIVASMIIAVLVSGVMSILV